MSRSRKVEPEAALQSAMSVFWKHGYCSLGTRQIEDETGITRFTLQTTYGGKMSLFLTVLDAYLDLLESFARPDCTNGNLEGLATWFETRTNSNVMPDISCYGCLMLNAIIEFSAESPEINLRAERYFNMLRNAFKTCLEAAKNNDTLPNDFDINAKAEVLVGIALSLNVVIRAATDNTAGQFMAASAATMIRDWGQP